MGEYDAEGAADATARELVAAGVSPIDAIKVMIDRYELGLAEAKAIVHRNLPQDRQRAAEALWDEVEVAVDENRSSKPSFRAEDLSEKWTVVLGAPEGERVRDELLRELPVGHTLYGTPALAVAVRRGGKETVWWLPEDGTWAVVHLTQSVETDPRWPSAVRVATWPEVIAELFDQGRG
jgi:hypothetical protein